MQIRILNKETLTPGIVEQANTLFCELNSDISQITLDKVLENNGHLVFAIAEENKRLAGMATMAIYTVISGHKGMIEDVVVSQHHRGRGIGRKLMEKLLEAAQNANLSEVLLFSGHHREAAIHLYKSLGFVLKNSGLYRLEMN